MSDSIAGAVNETLAETPSKRIREWAEGTVMTTPDIEAIRRRAEIGYAKCRIRPIADVDTLLSHIAALEAGHEAELLGMIAWLGDEGFFLLTGPDSNETILAAYLAQKEKK